MPHEQGPFDGRLCQFPPITPKVQTYSMYWSNFHMREPNASSTDHKTISDHQLFPCGLGHGLHSPAGPE